MNRRSWIFTILGFLTTLTTACTAAEPAHADSKENAMNRVQFHVERSREVANDRMTAIVGVTDEDSDSARLADRVNQVMKWALDQAKSRKAVDVQSGSYQTHPIHEDGKIRRWRASQDLVLASADVDALTALIGELQSQLLVRSIAFSVSPERRRAVEDELISECLDAYKKRAERIQEGLSARGFALVELSINTPTHHPGPRVARMQAEFSSGAAPALEAGESELTARVNATIELEN
jgi:predicted secreted protein